MTFEFRIETGDVTTIAPPPPAAIGISPETPQHPISLLPGQSPIIQQTTTTTANQQNQPPLQAEAIGPIDPISTRTRKRRKRKDNDEDFVPSGTEHAGSGSSDEQSDEDFDGSDDDSPENDDGDDDSDEIIGGEGGGRGPRKPRSAFNFYLEQKKPSVKAENPDLKPYQVRHQIQKMWKLEPQSEKKIFNALQSQDKERYKREIKEWKEKRLMSKKRGRQPKLFPQQNFPITQNSFTVEARRISGSMIPPPPIQYSFGIPQYGNGLVDTNQLRAASFVFANQMAQAAHLAAANSVNIPTDLTRQLPLTTISPQKQQTYAHYAGSAVTASLLSTISNPNLPPVTSTSAMPIVTFLPQPGSQQQNQQQLPPHIMATTTNSTPNQIQSSTVSASAVTPTNLASSLPPIVPSTIAPPPPVVFGPDGTPLKEEPTLQTATKTSALPNQIHTQIIAPPSGFVPKKNIGRPRKHPLPVDEFGNPLKKAPKGSKHSKNLPMDPAQMMISYTDADGIQHMLPLLLDQNTERILPDNCDWYCRICSRWVEETQENIVCTREGCGRCYHISCLGFPPGTTVPIGWICPETIGCKAKALDLLAIKQQQHKQQLLLQQPIINNNQKQTTNTTPTPQPPVQSASTTIPQAPSTSPGPGSIDTSLLSLQDPDAPTHS